MFLVITKDGMKTNKTKRFLYALCDQFDQFEKKWKAASVLESDDESPSEDEREIKVDIVEPSNSGFSNSTLRAKDF